MTTDDQIDRAIDKIHLKSTRKVIPHIQKQFADASPERVARINNLRPKDKYPRKKENYY